MNLTTPALLFPAISLLLLAYTNRFLTLAQVIRQLNASADRGAALVQCQLPGLKRRIALTQYMQGFGVLSFLLCALSMLALFLEAEVTGQWMFGTSIVTLAVSLVLSLIEVLLSTEALSLVVRDLEQAKGEGDGSGT
ncbi:DUF2721 domain-containing protein [Thauera phenylacetica]|jgi:hypothetical protein|uniref:II family cellulose-binding protein n=1 Tax=Thauera phenylacetica B4P TaxID=1234382 RepID=N6ZWV5_9RHOO|nr:DUF2721 domain-containing protein [Thauera phenylacetica]ENO98932.1 hypothetical protein C667_01035 [Thauera phenylacetica B4P]MBP7640908.1 DUF2721 domain-containing protein [Thauera sp.]HRM68688.1 DUF2721 domain-containing protein [Thauera phenylacetica]